ncbi:MAG: hypothetical protein QOF02_138 [Blastocatellia bacterium]|jgi:hypothetical protein|nr:hypothetical protein [Blastocatellia bacterium]
MEPEIARRCKSCGAAIRARSTFCPQCGVALAEEGAAASASVVAPERLAPPVADSRPSAKTTALAQPDEEPVERETTAKTETPAPWIADAPDAATPVAPAETASRAGVVAPVVPNAETVSDKRQRVSIAPSPASPRILADDGGVRRAEKLRRASNVVLDEAAADPSLRFVLVATALIIISIVLLLLARVL